MKRPLTTGQKYPKIVSTWFVFWEGAGITHFWGLWWALAWMGAWLAVAILFKVVFKAGVMYGRTTSA